MISENFLQQIALLTSSRIERFILLRYSPKHNEFVMCYDSKNSLSPYITLTESFYPSIFGSLNEERPYWLDKECPETLLTKTEIDLFSDAEKLAVVPINDDQGKSFSIAICTMSNSIERNLKEVIKFGETLETIRRIIEGFKEELIDICDPFLWLDNKFDGLLNHLKQTGHQKFDDKIQAALGYNVDSHSMILALSLYFGLPYVPGITNNLIRYEPRSNNGKSSDTYLQKSGLIILQELNSKTIIIASSNPRDETHLKFVDNYIPGRQVYCFTLPENIANFYNNSDLKRALEAEKEQDALNSIEQRESIQSEVDNEKPDTYVTKVVDRIINDAIKKGASDIHIEPLKGKDTEVRFRIDGSCLPKVASDIPTDKSDNVIRLLKNMALLDSQETGLPTDGKFTRKINGTEYGFRLATIPTYAGEAAVIRILKPGGILDIDQIGLSETNLERIKQVITSKQGIFLVVGPTGSGKTVSLHSVLKEINTDEKKIWTVEDPVELTQPRLQQVQIDNKKKRTFAVVLKALLRADPDVILVGEMRDKETAEIALRASLTGHFVLSTLHTNSALKSISRLIDMGLDHMNFSDALTGILSQRLVKKLCNCSEYYQLTDDDKKLAKQLGINLTQNRYHKKKGCEKCNKTGYKGRVGIHEFIFGSKEVRKAIYKLKPMEEIESAARKEGFTSLIEDAVEKAEKGLIDLASVFELAKG
jgi:type II secretory ATPase GspE/PulE/Tfp pilus assembly ATPase PilB-like protein